VGEHQRCPGLGTFPGQVHIRSQFNQKPDHRRVGRGDGADERRFASRVADGKVDIGTCGHMVTHPRRISRGEGGPKGPIKVRGGGRVADLDEKEIDASLSEDFDDFATSVPKVEDEGDE